MSAQESVFLVDDDGAVREAVTASLRRAGLSVRAYSSADEFLADCAPDWRGCAVLDVRMPRVNGLDLQRMLARRGVALPVLFISGYSDVAASVGAMRNGAVDFLEKPVAPEVLLTRIREALAQDRRRSDAIAQREAIRRRFAQLTTRERQVAALVMQGKTNKDVSRNLAISYRTVEKYRAVAMSKLGVSNFVELCRLGLDAATLFADDARPPDGGGGEASGSSALS